MACTVGLKYLRITDKQTIVVRARDRDWDDCDSEVHIEYHVALLDCVAGSFRVVIDARGMPNAACRHVRFFRRLCGVLRDKFKGRMDACRVVGAPAHVCALYNSLVATGHIPRASAAKITMVHDFNGLNAGASC